MGLLPQLNLGSFNITETVEEFLTLLRSINTKLDTLITLERGRNITVVGSPDVDHADDGWPIPVMGETDHTAIDINSYDDGPGDDSYDDTDEVLDSQILCDKPLANGTCGRELAHPGRCHP